MLSFVADVAVVVADVAVEVVGVCISVVVVDATPASSGGSARESLTSCAKYPHEG